MSRPGTLTELTGAPLPIVQAPMAGAAGVELAVAAMRAGALAARGCHAVIAQGSEAGGHAGWFLDGHRPMALARLLPRVLAAANMPVIAAGGIVDAEGVVAALGAGAAGVQVGTAYLATPESRISPAFRALLGKPAAADAEFTNLFSGREARGIRNRLMRELGPICDKVPAFPYASNALAPLREKAEADGRGDYSPLWAGAGAAWVRALGAEALTRELGQESE